MEKIESLINELPDPAGAKRFFNEFSEKHPGQTKKLDQNAGLLSDVLTVSNYSPLLATTILQHPNYVTWLSRERDSSAVREKEELLESLARFALTHSQLETHVLLARFRRRELIRIYLKDIRRLGTITEITEEISNLADAILTYALNIAQNELDKKYGIPLETDEKGRSTRALFCVVALGKLGSKELNYSSDIDLLFLFSKNGSTSGQGSRGVQTNKQYFVKLAEMIAKLVGEQTGEGAAYRVDMRLRPHGRVGALAISLGEAITYYQKTAHMWEKQVLIRSRAASGDEEVFLSFIKDVSANIFAEDETVENALLSVRKSKEQIDFEKVSRLGFDVKLGKGGIREIEFIAQALQLAFGGKDRWLRAPHTLISLSRLADRKYISEDELTQLFEAYDFLRRIEHNVQMEHGLQTHLVSNDISKREIVARRAGLKSVVEFNSLLERHTNAVNEIFKRIFGEEYIKEQQDSTEEPRKPKVFHAESAEKKLAPIISSLHKSETDSNLTDEKLEAIKLLSEITPPFAEMLAANPQLTSVIPTLSQDFVETDYRSSLRKALREVDSFSGQLAALRKLWARYIIEIAASDVFEKKGFHEVKTFQTDLAEACIDTAIMVTKERLEKEFGELENFSLGILGLGKLGGQGMDYGSDLDLVLLFDDEKTPPVKRLTHTQFYSKAAEIFVTVLSSLTREGSLYRVDLRLRPDGKNGAAAIGKNALVNYLETRAAIWEWLAYVKLRGVGSKLAVETERECRVAIHKGATKIDVENLRKETWRIRHRLAREKSKSRRGKEIDIKFGEGGLQDIYFAIRYLQLRDNIPDDDENRHTLNSLKKLTANDSLTASQFEHFANGYEFLSRLDHELRLTVGRSTLLPLGNKNALETIAKRTKVAKAAELLEKLTSHRLNVRKAFEEIVG